MVFNLDPARLILGLGLLGTAAVLDLRWRRVPNALWIEGAAFGAVLLAWDAYVFDRLQWTDWVFAALVVALAYVLWRSRLIAGGADAKAIMTLAVLLPTALHLEWRGRTFPLWQSPLPPAMVVLMNALLAMLAVPFVFFLRNALRGDWRVPAMFLGYRVPLERAVEHQVWIMERVDGQGRTVLAYFPSRWSREEADTNIQRLQDKGVARVWVTPKLPFMVPLFIGFVAAFLVGDILTRFLVPGYPD